MISSRHITQFIVVAEELHFGRAAQRLNISQPPLSQAIMRLEEALGVQLFERSKRAVTLTDAGRVFLEEAHHLVDRETEAIARTRKASAGVTGTFALGFVGSVSYELLPELLTKYRKHYPEVAFDLRELTSAEQMQELQARRIDAAIVRLPLSNVHDLEMCIIKRERMIAVLPINHPLASMESIPLAMLAGESFIMFPPNRVFSLPAKTLMACDAAGFSPRVALEAWQMPTMVSLVAAGMGIAILPSQIKNIPLRGVIYRELSDKSEHLELEIALAWRRDSRSILRDKFIEVVTKELDTPSTQ